MCQANDPTPGELQGGVTYTVPLEGGPGSMELVPVQLDHEPAIVPDEVHLQTGNEGVDGRWRQRRIATQIQKAPLELGSRGCRLAILA
jgi:hypothetical protein